jgi:hypothetical protein
MTPANQRASGTPSSAVLPFFMDLVATALMAMLFSCAPAVLTGEGRNLPPAYGLKLMRPFADTTLLTIPAEANERSHGNKLTPRLGGSIPLWSAGALGLHPYLPATCGTLLFLVSGLVLGRRLGGTRTAGLGLGCTYAGLFATSTGCAVTWMPKPFDGIALGFVGMASASVGAPVLLGIWSFLSLYTDERAAVSLCVVALLIFLIPHRSWVERNRDWLALGLSVCAFVATRVVIAHWSGWRPPDMNDVLTSYAQSLSYLQWSAWLCAEGGWAVIGLAVFLLVRRRLLGEAALFAVAVLLAVASIGVVQDMSRAAAFCFPIIPCALAILVRHNMRRMMAHALAASAIVSLLAPNCDIVRGVAMTWVIPLPLKIAITLCEPPTERVLP